MKDQQPPTGRRSAAKRALRSAASPFIGYFDRRFQDLHEHLEDQPQLDRLADDLREELSRTRADVAADTDTIVELSFTLERFADLFTTRMEELAARIAATAQYGGHELGSTIVEVPFAFAAAADIERGAAVATIGDDGRLSIGLAALGLHVTAIEPSGTIAHPDVATLDERIDDWGGPGEPFAVVFALSSSSAPSHAEGRPPREALERFRKWLRPTGLLVLAVRLDPDDGVAREDLEGLLTDWDVEREVFFEGDAGGAWRRATEVPTSGVAVVRAAPRA
jgi:hypothetical protein